MSTAAKHCSPGRVKQTTAASQFGLASCLSVDLDDDRHDIARKGDLRGAIRRLGSVEHLMWLLDQHRPAHHAATAMSRVEPTSPLGGTRSINCSSDTP